MGWESPDTVFDELAREKRKLPCFCAHRSKLIRSNIYNNKKLEYKNAGIFTEASMHTPTDIISRALEYVESVKADSVVLIEGEGTFGLGKAIRV